MNTKEQVNADTNNSLDEINVDKSIEIVSKIIDSASKGGFFAITENAINFNLYTIPQINTFVRYLKNLHFDVVVSLSYSTPTDSSLVIRWEN